MKLIKTKDKFILVSGEEPKINGDECIHLTTFNKSIHHDIDNNLTKWWKIISENPDFSLLSEEDCKTIGWYDVEKLAKNQFSVDKYQQDWAFRRMGFVLGFKTAQSLNDKMFSLEDMSAAIAFGFGICRKEDRAPFNKEIISFIQSLKQTSWNVEFEVEPYVDNNDFINDGKTHLLDVKYKYKVTKIL